MASEEKTTALGGFRRFLAGLIGAGDEVTAGPSGIPPAGLRAFEVVDADPNGPPDLVRPEGSIVVLRTGVTAWLRAAGAWRSFSSLGALYTASHGLSDVVALAGQVNPLMSLAGEAGEIGLMVWGHRAGLQLIIPPAANLVDGDWFRILTGAEADTIDVEVRATTVHTVTPGRYEWDIRTLTTAEECYNALWLILSAHTALTNPTGGGMGGLWYQSIEWSVVGVEGNQRGNEDHVADASFSLPSGFSNGLDPLPQLETVAASLVAVAKVDLVTAVDAQRGQLLFWNQGASGLDLASAAAAATARGIIGVARADCKALFSCSVARAGAYWIPAEVGCTPQIGAEAYLSATPGAVASEISGTVYPRQVGYFLANLVRADGKVPVWLSLDDARDDARTWLLETWTATGSTAAHSFAIAPTFWQELREDIHAAASPFGCPYIDGAVMTGTGMLSVVSGTAVGAPGTGDNIWWGLPGGVGAPCTITYKAPKLVATELWRVEVHADRLMWYAVAAPTASVGVYTVGVLFAAGDRVILTGKVA